MSSSGTPQAFALSLADVIHFSTGTGPFPNYAQRVGARNSWWWLRTSANVTPPFAWNVYFNLSHREQPGELHGGNRGTSFSDQFGGCTSSHHHTPVIQPKTIKRP